VNDVKIFSQLAALLRAGLSFHQAEREAGVDGLSPAAASDYRYLRSVVLASGGLASHAITRIRQVIEENQAQRRRVELANASPKATVRLVLWLPIAALVLGQLAGQGTIAVLFRSPQALVSVLIGGMLLAAGSYWSARMLRSARAEQNDQAIFLDAIAIGLTAGIPTKQAIDLASADYSPENNLQNELQELLDLSSQTGAALGKLLTEKADVIRSETNYKKSLALEKLSVRLMIPLGVSVLPAFALIAVVPLALSFLVQNKGA
jgi:tight adherence protein B